MTRRIALLALSVTLSGTLVACGPPGGGPQAADLGPPASPSPGTEPGTHTALGALTLPAAPLSAAPSPTPRGSDGAHTLATPAASPSTQLEPATPGEREQEDRTRALLHTIRTDPDPAVRRAAIDRWTDETRPLAPLMDAVFADPDPLVRRWAALAIGRKAGKQDQAALLQASRSETDPAVRRILEQAASRL